MIQRFLFCATINRKTLQKVFLYIFLNIINLFKKEVLKETFFRFVLVSEFAFSLSEHMLMYLVPQLVIVPYLELVEIVSNVYSLSLVSLFINASRQCNDVYKLLNRQIILVVIEVFKNGYESVFAVVELMFS